MLDAGIIEHVEESDWISMIVVQDKNTTGEVWICIDLRKLNDSCLHDPFLTPFTYEVLDSVRGQQIYPFIDGLRPTQYHLCEGMGLFPIHSNALWTQECSCYILQDSSGQFQTLYS